MEKRKHDDKLKELREVQSLSQHSLDLQKTNGALTDRVNELEAQIEKMKECIGELIAITDKEICNECDGCIHCSDCEVNHAQTYAHHFLNGN